MEVAENNYEENEALMNELIRQSNIE